MTLKELNTWISSAKKVYSHREYNMGGNELCYEIYEKDKNFFRIDYCNDYPTEYWNGKGYEKGRYELQLVIKKTRTITQTIYE